MKTVMTVLFAMALTSCTSLGTVSTGVTILDSCTSPTMTATGCSTAISAGVLKATTQVMETLEETDKDAKL